MKFIEVRVGVYKYRDIWSLENLKKEKYVALDKVRQVGIKIDVVKRNVLNESKEFKVLRDKRDF